MFVIINQRWVVFPSIYEGAIEENMRLGDKNSPGYRQWETHLHHQISISKKPFQNSKHNMVRVTNFGLKIKLIQKTERWAGLDLKATTLKKIIIFNITNPEVNSQLSFIIKCNILILNLYLKDVFLLAI